MIPWLKRSPTAADDSGRPERPSRIYVISGKVLQPYKEPTYSTDLRSYGIPLKAGITDEQYEAVRAGLKAFVKRNDAITFAYHCNLDSVTCPVYDRVGDEWKYNAEETGRMADDIN